MSDPNDTNLVCFYSFDIFNKNIDSPNIIADLSKEFGTYDFESCENYYKNDPTHGGIKSYKEKRNLWQFVEFPPDSRFKGLGLVINSLLKSNPWKSPTFEELDDELPVSIDVVQTIKRIDLLVINNEDFPYYLLILKFTLKLDELNNEYTVVHTDSPVFHNIKGLEMIFHAYLAKFGGVLSRVTDWRFRSIAYFRVGNTKEDYLKIKNIYSLISSKDSSNSSKVEFVDLLSDVLLLDQIWYADVISVFFHTDYEAVFSGLINNSVFIISFTDTVDVNLYRGSKKRFINAHPDMTHLYHYDDSPLSIIYILCEILWINYLLRGANTENAKIIMLGSSIDDDIRLKNFKQLRNDQIELNKSGTNVIQLITSFRQYNRSFSSFLSELKYLARKEIQIKSTDWSPLPIFKMLYDKSTFYNKELDIVLNEQHLHYESLNSYISNIVNLDIQQSLSKYTIISMMSGIAAAVAAIIILFK